MEYEKGKWYIAKCFQVEFIMCFDKHDINGNYRASDYIGSNGKLLGPGSFNSIIRRATLEEITSGKIDKLNNIVPKTIIKTKNMDEGDLELEMMFQKSKTKTSPRVRIKESDIDRQQLSSRSGATSNKYDGVFPLKRDANRPLLFNSPEYNKLRRH